MLRQNICGLRPGFLLSVRFDNKCFPHLAAFYNQKGALDRSQKSKINRWAPECCLNNTLIKYALRPVYKFSYQPKIEHRARNFVYVPSRSANTIQTFIDVNPTRSQTGINSAALANFQSNTAKETNPKGP